MDYIDILSLSIKENLHGLSGHTGIALKYITSVFLNKETTSYCSNEWQDVIEIDFTALSRNVYKRKTKNNRHLSLESLLSILNRNKMLENAWFQWAKFLQNHFDQSTIKDINIGSAAMKCYVIASKLTRNYKSDILIARVCIILNNYVLLLNIKFIFINI